MGTPYVVAHVSDLHVSTFGDTFHDARRIIKRSARVADTEPSRFRIAWEEAGWRVLRETKNAKKVSLVDPDGYSHPIPSVKIAAGLRDAVERAAWKACRLEARRATTLARSVPSAGAVDILAHGTPENSNVRLLFAARAIGEDVDCVIATGDLTDDGAGYELVAAAFARFRDRGRLVCVPGNHDMYLFPLAGSGRPRPTHESKRAAWTAFATRVGLALEPCGASVKELPEADAIVVGLDSCARGQRRFFRHNGAVGPEQLAFLYELAKTPAWKNARHKLIALHHHVVPLPLGVGKRAPSEIGMRLDDARASAECFDAIGVTLVMHGHRHVSEQRQPAGSNFIILAAPSFTLGCKSGDGASYWRIELGERMHIERVHVGVAAVEEADEGSEVAESE